VIVKNEMGWTLAWFLHQRKKWEGRVLWAEREGKTGHGCYAAKQVVIWEKMMERCKDEWKEF
jgi:hypothetical protein